MSYGLGLGISGGCANPLGCGLFCRHRGASHGYWSAAQAQNGNPFAAAGQGNPGAIQARFLAQQNTYNAAFSAAAVAQQAASLAAFAGAGIGASLGRLLGSGLLGTGLQLPAAAPAPAPTSFANLPNDGIEVGEIIAWRCWRLIGRGLLQSTAFNHVWPPDRPMTGKIDHDYAGVHAWKEREDARIMFEHGMAGAGAWGAVALWGELVEHERGFRAENACVVAIEAVRPSRHGHILGRVTDRWRLNQLHARYGVGSWADYLAGERSIRENP
jgi:hypothetical protein